MQLSRKKTAELNKIKSDHNFEIANLESYYEDRLIEASKQVESVKSEFELSLQQHRNEISRKDNEYRSKIEELSSTHSSIESKLQAKISSLLEEIGRIEKVKLEMLDQQGEEYERELSQNYFLSHKRIRHKQQAIDDKNVEVRHLTSKNEQLMRQVKEQKGMISHQREVRAAEASRIQSFEEEMRKMKELVQERDRSLSESNAIIHSMKVDQIALETKLYSIQARMAELENSRIPLSETIKRQDAEEKSLLKKLGQTNTEIESLRLQIGLKKQLLNKKEQEISSMKGIINDRDRRLRSLELVLINSVNCGSDRQLRHEMNCAYQKFIFTDISHELISRSSSSKESAGRSMEKRMKISKAKANHEVKKIKDSKRIRENTVLMADIDILQEENSNLKKELTRLNDRRIT